AGVEADQQIGMAAHGQGFQQIVQPDRAELGRSPAGSGQAGQGGFLEHPGKFHKISPIIGNSPRETHCGKNSKAKPVFIEIMDRRFRPFPFRKDANKTPF
ncbi:MAG: hypothetical protein ACLFPR_02010, partial [Desulfococcaceae bacterium]